MISKAEKLKEIERLAMSDELFSPESISLEPKGKSLTVRLPEKFKRFNRKLTMGIPAWGEDYDLEKDCFLL